MPHLQGDGGVVEIVIGLAVVLALVVGLAARRASRGTGVRGPEGTAAGASGTYGAAGQALHRGQSTGA